MFVCVCVYAVWYWSEVWRLKSVKWWEIGQNLHPYSISDKCSLYSNAAYPFILCIYVCVCVCGLGWKFETREHQVIKFQSFSDINCVIFVTLYCLAVRGIRYQCGCDVRVCLCLWEFCLSALHNGVQNLNFNAKWIARFSAICVLYFFFADGKLFSVLDFHLKVQ